ncbi:MAG: Fur family transcriptional regulator [Acidiferrobacterales bacterium]
MPRRRILVPFKKRTHDHKKCINHAVASAQTTCEKRGLRLTKLRRRVLELVWRRHMPMKAYDILDQLRKEGRAAAPPTVYRALDFLLEAGLVHRIESLNAFVGCGGPGTPHSGQFLICRRCRAVAEIDAPAVAKALVMGAERLGFQADRQTIEIKGLCSNCSGTA